jgi:hypothetical protein
MEEQTLPSVIKKRVIVPRIISRDSLGAFDEEERNKRIERKSWDYMANKQVNEIMQASISPC